MQRKTGLDFAALFRLASRAGEENRSFVTAQPASCCKLLFLLSLKYRNDANRTRGLDALSGPTKNVLTRRANQGHDSIIATFVKTSVTLPDNGRLGAINLSRQKQFSLNGSYAYFDAFNFPFGDYSQLSALSPKCSVTEMLCPRVLAVPPA